MHCIIFHVISFQYTTLNYIILHSIHVHTHTHTSRHTTYIFIYIYTHAQTYTDLYGCNRFVQFAELVGVFFHMPMLCSCCCHEPACFIVPYRYVSLCNIMYPSVEFYSSTLGRPTRGPLVSDTFAPTWAQLHCHGW